MKITLELDKTLEQNADALFQQSKAARDKAARIRTAIEKTRKEKPKKPKQRKEIKRPVEWYERFRWFFSSEGVLVLCGRNAEQNEELVKKYLRRGDRFLHAEVHGAPACILRREGAEAAKVTEAEAAQAAASYSSAWRGGLSSVDVYAVDPEQVSKQAPSGEYISKGAFMIRGKRTWYKKTPLELAVGVEEGEKGARVVAGPLEAVKKPASFWVVVRPGKASAEQAANELKKLFADKIKSPLPSSEEWIKALPSGRIGIEAR